MPPICVMLKPASGSCDLRCQYCFYHDITENRLCPNYGMMSEATLEAVIQKTLAYAEGSCSFIYQGGEPTLAGLEFYRKSLALQKNMRRWDYGLKIPSKPTVTASTRNGRSFLQTINF